MNSKIKKLSMRNRMMISFVVPLFFIYLLVSAVGYPYLLRRTGDDIWFQVEDNGPGMTEQQMRDAVSVDPRQAQQGYGIKNINFRIKLCFGERYGVHYGGAPGGGTIAYIHIPAMTMAEAEQRGL